MYRLANNTHLEFCYSRRRLRLLDMLPRVGFARFGIPSSGPSAVVPRVPGSPCAS